MIKGKVRKVTSSNEVVTQGFSNCNLCKNHLGNLKMVILIQNAWGRAWDACIVYKLPDHVDAAGPWTTQLVGREIQMSDPSVDSHLVICKEEQVGSIFITRDFTQMLFKAKQVRECVRWCRGTVQNWKNWKAQNWKELKGNFGVLKSGELLTWKNMIPVLPNSFVFQEKPEIWILNLIWNLLVCKSGLKLNAHTHTHTIVSQVNCTFC